MKKKKQVQNTDMASQSSLDSKIDEINTKLSKMLTKDDKVIFKTIIKETFQELKEELLGSIIKRLDILESDVHKKEIENDNIKTELKQIKKEISNKTKNTKQK